MAFDQIERLRDGNVDFMLNFLSTQNDEDDLIKRVRTSTDKDIIVMKVNSCPYVQIKWILKIYHKLYMHV